MTHGLNGLDWMLVVAVGLSTIAGFRAGFARVVVGFIAGIIGLLAAFWFYDIPAAWFASYVKSPPGASALGFVVVFAGVLIVGGVVARVLAGLFRWVGLSWLDRVMGAGAGFLRGMALAVAITAPLLAFAPDPLPAFLEESRMLPYATNFGRIMVAVAPKQLREQFDIKFEALKELWLHPGSRSGSEKAEAKPELRPDAKPEPKPEPKPQSKKTEPLKRQSY